VRAPPPALHAPLGPALLLLLPQQPATGRNTCSLPHPRHLAPRHPSPPPSPPAPPHPHPRAGPGEGLKARRQAPRQEGAGDGVAHHHGQEAQVRGGWAGARLGWRWGWT
jgi:hypothetical protein